MFFKNIVIEHFNPLIDEAAKLMIGAAQEHALDTPSVSQYASPSPSTAFSSFGRTDKKDRKEKDLNKE